MTKRFERIYEDVDVFCRDHNAKGLSQLIEREDYDKIVDLLNELNDEKEWLEMNNKDLVSFIKSKGYILKDFLKYVGQFSSVEVNKEDWND